MYNSMVRPLLSSSPSFLIPQNGTTSESGQVNPDIVVNETIESICGSSFPTSLSVIADETDERDPFVNAAIEFLSK